MAGDGRRAGATGGGDGRGRRAGATGGDDVNIFSALLSPSYNKSSSPSFHFTQMTPRGLYYILLIH
jgi:hypothetical protein